MLLTWNLIHTLKFTSGTQPVGKILLFGYNIYISLSHVLTKRKTMETWNLVHTRLNRLNLYKEKGPTKAVRIFIFTQAWKKTQAFLPLALQENKNKRNFLCVQIIIFGVYFSCTMYLLLINLFHFLWLSFDIGTWPEITPPFATALLI